MRIRTIKKKEFHKDILKKKKLTDFRYRILKEEKINPDELLIYETSYINHIEEIHDKIIGRKAVKYVFAGVCGFFTL